MSVFDARDVGLSPWRVGRPQDAIIRLAENGLIGGDVLELGCGAGDNALFLAEVGYDVCGVDVAARAIAEAQAKALARELTAEFVTADVLHMPALERRFDTVIDCGLFHTFTNESRALYRRSLAAVMRPGSSLFLLCVSDEEESDWGGPRRITRRELHDCFNGRFAIESIEPTRYRNALNPQGSKSWLVRILYLGVAVSTRN